MELHPSRMHGAYLPASLDPPPTRGSFLLVGLFSISLSLSADRTKVFGKVKATAGSRGWDRQRRPYTAINRAETG